MELESLQEIYYDKSLAAFKAGDFKFCLVMMKRVRMTKKKFVDLLVNCAYEGWLSGHESFETAIEAFTNLLRDIDPSLVTSSEYIRLSHIYLSEGALDGALRILGLASARGHLADASVVLQSYTIVKRIQSRKEADVHMSFLSSSIVVEPRTVDSTGRVFIKGSVLRIIVAYLFCATYQQREVKKAKNSKELHSSITNFNSLVAESYAFQFGNVAPVKVMLAWFADHSLWYSIGDELISTPYILLAEDAYWESFIRKKYDSSALLKIVSCLEQTKRKSAFPIIIERAQKVSPWNTYCRSELRKIHHKWEEIFEEENFFLGKIQVKS